MSDPERTGGWRLANATSAYLRSAREQSIDWHPWGEEAFELARRTQRPILLDIGAAWCHWCHVMDEGTYSDAAVGRILAEHFVAVKVDRDEHPEVDRRYQRQVGALTGEGGWPLTAFLTPEGSVFLGGTYFPPTDGMGRPGFRRVLTEVARLWKEEPDKIRGNIESAAQSLARLRAPRAGPTLSDSAFLSGVRAQIHQSYDPVNGGFGMAPKFPHPTAISYLLFDAFASGDDASAQRARETLRRMADGGMYDQLAGGFHRYSVDEGWHIPHFEKMGVDNAALLSAYVEGARRFGDPRLVETVRGTTRWLTTVLAHPDGGFSASQDADNAPGDDGGYFTWTRAELKAILDPDELRLITRVFGVGSEGRMPHDPNRNVLYRLMTPAEAAEGSSLDPALADRKFGPALQKLRHARTLRPTPVVDPARYSSLNGAILRSLVAAARFTGDAAPLLEARRTADLFLSSAYDPKRGVAHRLDPKGADGFGLLEDQTEFAYGLVELAGATLDEKYLNSAEVLLQLVDQEFRGESGLLRDIAPSLYTGPTVGTLPEPSYPLEDNPHLSPNSAAVLAFLRFSSLTGRSDWTEKARALLLPIQARVRDAGLFAASAALATGIAATPPARVVIEGTGPDAERLARAAESAWHPNVWVFRGPPPAPFALPEEVVVSEARSGPARALVCFGTHCLAPVTDPGELAPLLLRGGRSNAG